MSVMPADSNRPLPGRWIFRFAFIVLFFSQLPVASYTGGPLALTGHVLYRERMALPPAAVVKVVLLDVSRADAPAKEISQVTFDVAGKQSPFPFRMLFDSGDIKATQTYAVRAQILLDGKMIFTSTIHYPVITRGAPYHAEVVVEPVKTIETTKSEFEGVEWKLVQVGGLSVMSDGADANITFHADGKKISGSGGCNRLTGSYQLDGNSLRISPLGMTRMACPEPQMKQEQEVNKALEATNGYKLSGNTLELLNGEKVLAQFRSGKSK